MPHLTLLWAALASLIGPPATPAPASAAGFTIEQVLAAPFPSDLVASPSGGAVAWAVDARGLRNVWIAEPPDYRGRAVTSYAGDDGQEIGQLRFAPDGRNLVFVRGGDTDSAGSPEPDEQPGRRDAGDLRRSGCRRRAETARGGKLPRRLAAGGPCRLRGERRDLVGSPRRFREGLARLRRPRALRQPALVPRRLAARLRLFPRRPRLRRASSTRRPGRSSTSTRASTGTPSLPGRQTAGASRSSGSPPPPRPARSSARTARACPGRSASRMRRPERGARSSAPTPARAASSGRSSPTVSSSGPTATGSCSRGRRTGGRTSTRCRPRAARPILLTPGAFEVEDVRLSSDRPDRLLQLEPGRHRAAPRLERCRRREASPWPCRAATASSGRRCRRETEKPSRSSARARGAIPPPSSDSAPAPSASSPPGPCRRISRSRPSSSRRR